MLLQLRVDVDPGEPAAVTGVGVVPPADVLRAPGLVRRRHEVDHVLVGLVVGVDAGLRALHGQRERVHHHESVPDHLALRVGGGGGASGARGGGALGAGGRGAG